MNSMYQIVLWQRIEITSVSYNFIILQSYTHMHTHMHNFVCTCFVWFSSLFSHALLILSSQKEWNKSNRDEIPKNLSCIGMWRYGRSLVATLLALNGSHNDIVRTENHPRMKLVCEWSFLCALQKKTEEKKTLLTISCDCRFESITHCQHYSQ